MSISTQGISSPDGEQEEENSTRDNNSKTYVSLITCNHTRLFYSESISECYCTCDFCTSVVIYWYSKCALFKETQ